MSATGTSTQLIFSFSNFIYTMRVVPQCDEKWGENHIDFFLNWNYHFVREQGTQQNREHRNNICIRIGRWQVHFFQFWILWLFYYQEGALMII